jgi:hypothetical protein
LSHQHDARQLLNRKQSPRSVDELLWKGDPKASPVQRVGLVIYALMFLFLFVVLIVIIVMIVKDGFDWISFLGVLMMGTLSGIFGFRFLFNAFRRQRHHKEDRYSLS